jgi:secreted trypsin-like serine protease
VVANGFQIQTNPPRIFNDLALLFLDKPVSTATPRPFAGLNDIEKASTVQLVGYGATNPTGTANYGTRREAPQVVPSPILSPKWPANADRYGCDPKLEFVCGPNKTGTDSCNGDSGGPASIKINGKEYIAGVVSRDIVVNGSEGLCGQGGIYTRVDQYEQWIKETMNDPRNLH